MFHRIEHVLRRGTGLAVAGASITVLATGTSSKPTLYATNDTSQPISNPVITDENGRYHYWVANGVYDEVVVQGSVTETETGIQMYDLSSPLVAGVAWGAIAGSIAAQADLAAALNLKANLSGIAAVGLSGNAADLSSGTVNPARLPLFASGAAGAVPQSGGGIVNFLRADGTWAPPPGSGGGGGTLIGSGYVMTTARFIGRTTALTGAPEELTPAAAKALLAIVPGDVAGLAAIASSGSGGDLAANSVALSKLATQSNNTILGNISGGAAAPAALTVSQVKTMLALSGADVIVGVASQTGVSYTAVLADAGTYIRFNNASTIMFTIPLNATVAFPIGTEIELEQAGAGAVTVGAAGGVSINSRGGSQVTAGQYAVASLKKVGTDAWTLTGDLL